MFTVFVPQQHDALHILGVVYDVSGQVLDENAHIRPLFDLQPEILVLAQQVPHFFVVDLQIGDPHEESGNRKNISKRAQGETA